MSYDVEIWEGTIWLRFGARNMTRAIARKLAKTWTKRRPWRPARAIKIVEAVRALRAAKEAL